MNIIGEDQSDYFQPQMSSFDCAVAAQVSIINQFLPSSIPLEEGLYVSAENGWTTTEGTDPSNMGRLMDAYDIPVHQVHDASIEQLASELQAGHRVIVGVNSDELWDTGASGDFWNWFIEVFGLDSAEFTPANHAVVVTGIDMSDKDNPMVIVNDSGDPDGESREYPLRDFMDAWENSGFHYVATSEPPPDGSAIPAEELDIFNYLGIGAGLVSLAYTMDPMLSMMIGSSIAEIPQGGEEMIVENSINTVMSIAALDWDSILETV